MPYNLAVGDAFQLKFFCNRNQQNGINVLTYQVTNVAGTGQSDQQVADAIGAIAAPVYKNYLDTGSAYAGIRGQVLKPALQPPVVSLVGAGAGTRIGDQLPSMVTMLLSLRTASAGRRGRGRLYLPFWMESDNQVGATPSGAAIALAAAWATAVVTPLTIGAGGNTVTVRPIIFARDLWLPGLFVNVVLVRNQWATQRRRSQINRTDTLGP